LLAFSEKPLVKRIGNPGICWKELCGGRGSPHVRHHYVQYRQIGPLEFRQAKDLPPVGSGEHLVTKPG
jgi:hypothetical protein